MKYGLYLAICLMTLLQFQTSFGQGTTLTFTTVFPTCNGAANGSATVQAIGGATPYTYKWSNGQTTQTAVNLVAGAYTVTVTTATNQTATGFTILQQPAAVVANIVRSGFNCSTTGTLSAQASGGNGGPYTYSWSNGQNTANINVNTAGTYKVTVTDGAGCTATDEEIILQNLVADVQTTNLLCNTGPANGTAIASAQGGKAPYTYLWNTGATTKSIQNLGQDTYTVTVTDANNCTSSDYGLVSKPSPILVSITINSPSCNGSNGSATLLATGGTAPYIYVWKSLNNALGATQNNLAPGPYLVSIFDANGCEKEVTVKVPGQGGLAIQLGLSKTECTGVDIGKAIAFVTPSGTYNYSWNVQPNVNASQITGLAANTQVSVTVTNPSSGCSGTASGVIGVQHEIKVAVTDTDIACAADKNGTATAVASLGVAPYTYAWNYNNTFYANGANLNNLAIGTYTVTATDAKGCIATNTANISAQSNPTAAFQLSAIECSGSQINIQFLNQSTDPLSTLTTWVWTVKPDGSAPFVLNGATPPNMLFPEGQTGTVTLTVTSAKGCSATLTKPYKIASAPTFEVAIQAPGFTCDAQPVHIKVIGNPIYTYTWTPTQGLNLTNAPFDVIANPTVTTQYILTVQSGQCVGKDTVLIKRSVPLNLQVASDSIVTCGPTAILSATANPAAHATFQWFQGTTLIGTGPNVQVQAVGKVYYTVVATDENGCTGSKKVSVTGKGVTNINIQFDASGNICAQGPVTIKVTGSPAYTYVWTPNPTLNLAGAPFTVVANPALTTTYFLSVSNGVCDSIFKVTIPRSNTPIGLAVSTNNQVTCDSISNIKATVTTTNAVTYQWFNSNGVVVDQDAILNVAAAGTHTYTVVATDINGCTESKIVTVTGQGIEGVKLTAQNNGNDPCSATPVTIIVTGNPAYTYNWTANPTLNIGNAPHTTVIANPLVTTTYFLTVVNGICTKNYQITIPRSNTPIGLAVSTNNQVTCDSISNIKATVTTTNAVTYQWLNSNGLVVDQDAILNVATAGTNTYTVVATDINGCTESKIVTVTGQGIEGVKLTAQNNGNDPCAALPVTITVTGNPAYTYNWTADPTLNIGNAPHTTVIANPLVTTTYFLTVVNDICSKEYKITIPRSNTPIGLAVSTDNQLTCDSISNIKATVTTTNAVTYQWLNSNGLVVDQDAILNVAAAGTHTYTVVATDINGCTESKIVTVTGQGIEGVKLSAQNNGNDPCSASPVTITVTGNPAYTYNWTADPTLNIGNAPHTTVIANPLVTTTYFLTVVNGICTKNYQITIPRSNTPIGLAVSTDNQLTCDSISNIKATVTTTNAVTYQWLNSNGVVVDQDAILNVATAGTNTYTVVATDINGCTESKIVTVTGQGIEGVKLTAQNNGNDPCAALPVTITVTGNPAYTYNWTADPTLNIGNAPHTTGIANPLVTTTYFLTVVNGICSKNYTIIIQRSNTPIGLKVSTNNLVTCDSISNVIATVTTTKAVTFQWLDSNGVVVDQDAILNVATAGTHTYTVVATDINGCTEAKPVTITGNGVENVSIQVQTNPNPCELKPIPITVTGSLTYTYNWTSDPTLDLSGAPFNVIANPTQSTTYVLQVNNGVCTRTYNIPVTVNYQAIDLKVSTKSIVTCAATASVTASVNASTTVTYQWLDSNGQVVDSDAVLNVASAGNHTYTVVATASNGCTQSESVQIQGHAIENVSLKIDPGANACDTLPVLIQVIGDPNNSYLWIPNATLDQSQGAPFKVYAHPKVTTTYKLQVSNLFCDSTFSVTIERKPPVDVTVSTEIENTCADLSHITASSTADPNVTYQWISVETGLTVDNDALLNVASAGTHTYTLIVTNPATGCTATKTVTVNGQGVDIKLDTSLPDKECEGKQLPVCVLNLDPSDNLVYNWTGSAGVNITPADAACPMITGPAGNYTLTVIATNQFNCKDTMQVPVEFEKSANLKGAISIDLCNRLKVKFFNTSGIPGTWQFGDNSPASTETNPLHTYANSGTYNVVFTPLQSGNCITAYDTLLKVNATPPILANFSNTTANCINNALIDFKDLSFHLNQIVDWNWSFPAGQPASANTPNPSAQFSQNGNPLVTLIVTDTLGCSDTITKPLQIDLIPTLQADSLKFCEGGSVQLNPDLSPGFQYVWSANPPDSNLQVNAANPTVSPLVPTLYSVNVKNGLCSADFTVLVEPQPQATVNIAGVGKDTLLCTLDPITLSANSNSVNNLIWSNNSSFNPVLGTGASYTLQTTDPNYVLYVKAGLNGCDAIDSILVKNRAVRVDIGAYANQICKGSSTILNLINLSPSQNLTYTWSPELPSVANPVVAPSVKTNYAVTVTNAEGCTSTAILPVDVLDLSVNATVVGSDTVKAGEFATLLATTTGTPGTISYQWIPATGLSNPLGAQTQATPTEDSTVYTVIAQVDGRCPDTAQVIVYLRNDFCLEPYIFVPNAFTPNGDKNNDYFIVRFSDATELEFIVWDRWGEIVYQTTDINALGWDGSFKGKDATPDSYAWYVRIKCGNGNKYVKKGNVTLLK